MPKNIVSIDHGGRILIECNEILEQWRLHFVDLYTPEDKEGGECNDGELYFTVDSDVPLSNTAENNKKLFSE